MYPCPAASNEPDTASRQHGLANKTSRSLRAGDRIGETVCDHTKLLEIADSGYSLVDVTVTTLDLGEDMIPIVPGADGDR